MIKSAKEYKRLYSGDTEHTLTRIEALVEKEARKGKLSARLPYELYYNEGYNVFLKNKQVEEILLEKDFKLIPKDESRQFVDVWLEISWDV